MKFGFRVIVPLVEGGKVLIEHPEPFPDQVKTTEPLKVARPTVQEL
jgi:hypothetical protein